MPKKYYPKYDGWIFKNKWGSLCPCFFGYRRKDVVEKIGVDRWENAWKHQGHKIVKVKFIEVQ